MLEMIPNTHGDSVSLRRLSTVTPGLSRDSPPAAAAGGLGGGSPSPDWTTHVAAAAGPWARAGGLTRTAAARAGPQTDSIIIPSYGGAAGLSRPGATLSMTQ